MRRFNLVKPETAGGAGDEAASDRKAESPSKRRLLLLCLLLVLVIAVGGKNLISTYIWREPVTPVPAPVGVVTLPADQSPRPAPTPPMRAPELPQERLAKAPRPDAATQPKLTLTPPPNALERNIQRETAEPPAPKPKARGRFSVQVAAMAHEANARALSQRLKKLGYPVTIQRGRASRRSYHVVLVGLPSDRGEATTLTDKLRTEGFSPLVVESDGRYRVEAGRSVELDQAIDLAHELQKKGFTPKIASETATATLYLVRVGQFTSRGEAGRRAKELQASGFPALLVKN